MKTFVSIILFVLGGFGVIQSQSILFNFTNGTNSSYPLANIRKIDFKPDSMVLHFNSGTLLSFSISAISYYYYQPSISSVDLIDNGELSVKVFPNPSNEKITIHYCLRLNETVAIKIYDVVGKLIHNHIEKMQPAGDYLFEWETNEKGTFIVTLVTNEKMISETFIIL